MALLQDLQKNKAVRTYLSHFREQDIKRAIKLGLIYGIQCLQARHRLTGLSIKDLEDIVARNTTFLTVEEHIPDIAAKLTSLKNEINNLNADILNKQNSKSIIQPSTPEGLPVAPVPEEQPPVRQPVIAQPDRQKTSAPSSSSQSRPTRTVNPSSIHGATRSRSAPPAVRPSPFSKPSSRWRSGDPVVYSKQPPKRRAPASEINPESTPIHPPWWGHSTHNAKRPSSAAKQVKPDPKLAYSTQQQHEPNRNVLKDDLVTTAYLEVPSSNYGQPQPQVESVAVSSGGSPAAAVEKKTVSAAVKTVKKTASKAPSSRPKSAGDSVVNRLERQTPAAPSRSERAIDKKTGLPVYLQKVESSSKADIEMDRKRRRNGASSSRVAWGDEGQREPISEPLGLGGAFESAPSRGVHSVLTIADSFLESPLMRHFVPEKRTGPKPSDGSDQIDVTVRRAAGGRAIDEDAGPTLSEWLVDAAKAGLHSAQSHIPSRQEVGGVDEVRTTVEERLRSLAPGASRVKSQPGSGESGVGRVGEAVDSRLNLSLNQESRADSFPRVSVPSFGKDLPVWSNELIRDMYSQPSSWTFNQQNQHEQPKEHVVRKTAPGWVGDFGAPHSHLRNDTRFKEVPTEPIDADVMLPAPSSTHLRWVDGDRLYPRGATGELGAAESSHEPDSTSAAKPRTEAVSIPPGPQTTPFRELADRRHLIHADDQSERSFSEMSDSSTAFDLRRSIRRDDDNLFSEPILSDSIRGQGALTASQLSSEPR